VCLLELLQLCHELLLPSKHATNRNASTAPHLFPSPAPTVRAVLGLNRTTNSTSLFTPSLSQPPLPAPIVFTESSWVHTVSGEDAGDIDDMNKLVKKLINCLKSGNGGPGRGGGGGSKAQEGPLSRHELLLPPMSRTTPDIGGGSSKAQEGPLTLDEGSPNNTQSSSMAKNSSVAQNDCPPLPPQVCLNASW
jgi:hypothetical protein